MASEFFRGLIGSDIIAIYGLTPDAMWVLFALLLSIGLGIIVSVELKNKNMGIVMFLFSILFSTFLGMIDFFVIIVPLIIGTSLFLMFRHHRGSG